MSSSSIPVSTPPSPRSVAPRDPAAANAPSSHARPSVAGHADVDTRQTSRHVSHLAPPAGLQAGLAAPGGRASLVPRDLAAGQVRQAFADAGFPVDFEERDEAGVPFALYCPIGMRLLREPVAAVSVAADRTEFTHHYEQADLQQWIDRFGTREPTSPANNQPLKADQVFTVDTGLQRAIEIFLAKDPKFHAKLTKAQRKILAKIKTDSQRAHRARKFLEKEGAAQASRVRGTAFTPARAESPDERRTRELRGIQDSLLPTERAFFTYTQQHALTRAQITERLAEVNAAVRGQNRRYVALPVPQSPSMLSITVNSAALFFGCLLGRNVAQALNARYPLLTNDNAGLLGDMTASAGWLALQGLDAFYDLRGRFRRPESTFRWMPILVSGPEAPAATTPQT
jgi:hypothetical protein